ncbi:MAG: hypothetical protein P8Z36_13300 [Gemmatimonadota bacterium]
MPIEKTEKLPRPNPSEAEAALERILRAAGTGEESRLAGLIESTDDAVFVSQPLNVGDRFGSLLLKEFVPEP